jgi:hypothetical protein
MAEIVLKTNQPEKVHQILSETLETEISRIAYSSSYCALVSLCDNKTDIKKREITCLPKK